MRVTPCPPLAVGMDPEPVAMLVPDTQVIVAPKPRAIAASQFRPELPMQPGEEERGGKA
jgi:hypothetical protein